MAFGKRIAKKKMTVKFRHVHKEDPEYQPAIDAATDPANEEFVVWIDAIDGTGHVVVEALTAAQNAASKGLRIYVLEDVDERDFVHIWYAKDDTHFRRLIGLRN